jgi:hypothetical protein
VGAVAVSIAAGVAALAQTISARNPIPIQQR